MKLSRQLIAGALAIGWSGLLIAAAADKPAAKPDAVSGATKPYSEGDRGMLPPKGYDYEVLGVKDGLKSWAVKYDGVLLRGGEIHADSAAAAFKDWGVKTVISIVPGDKERDFCKRHNLALVEIPFAKTKGPSAADLKLFLDTVRKGAGAFYVHCVGGAHRGGILGVAYRVHVLQWPYERALVEFGRLGGSLKDDHAMLEAVRQFKP